MKKYQAVRISRNGIPTYGDRYERVYGDYAINEIISVGLDRYIILFEEEEQKLTSCANGYTGRKEQANENSNDPIH